MDVSREASGRRGQAVVISDPFDCADQSQSIVVAGTLGTGKTRLVPVTLVLAGRSKGRPLDLSPNAGSPLGGF